jgi:hypothetical protein
MPVPVELTIYDSNYEPVKKLSRLVIPWGVLKKAVRMAKTISAKNPNDLGDDEMDAISDLIIHVFGEEKITRAELDAGVDIGDMVTTIQAIVARGQGLLPNAPPAAK